MTGTTFTHMVQPEHLLRKAQVTERLNVSKRTVDRLIAAGELKAVRLTQRTTRITAESVEDYLKRCAA